MRTKPKKSLGQNYLIDQNIINFISLNGNIKPENDILEIGPGTGNLTRQLLKVKFRNFHVIEKDKKLSENLSKEFRNINIINEDFFNVDLEKLKMKNIIIFGNLPYNVSSQILVKLIKSYNEKFKFNKLLLMFQKELADRIIANYNTRNYGRLSIISQWRMEIIKLKDISPKSFNPVPKVNSTILYFKPKKKIFKFKNLKNLEYITNVFFNLRRKMIKKPLKILFGETENISKKMNLNLNLRPQMIKPEIFYKICNEYENYLSKKST